MSPTVSLPPRPTVLEEVSQPDKRLELAQIESALERALELLGDKYSLQIVNVLHQFQPQRFVELEDQINGISPRTLSARLKQLEAAGVIVRTQFATIPPKVEYTLTELGLALAPVVQSLVEWANTHYPYQPVVVPSR